MKTDDMISLLAANVAPVDRDVLARRYRWGVLLGALGSVLLMSVIFGIRPDIQTMMVTPLFWAKIAFPAGVAAAALLTAVRLSRPGMPVGHGWRWLAVPPAVVWVAAALVLAVAPAPERLPMILGSTWRTCPFNIALLSVPTFIGVFWAMKGLAPTRLRAAGAVAGLLASSVAAIAYCLHCPEMGVAFWAVWYVAGMLLPALLGALLGPALLRW
ncbi:hypothetical protein AKI39_18185 [Bordetella sp. H567]|uniref:DUF1109 domain-containing protein n=1 Tax=Bordetella sp. H567 TaxID=1697043 RepID=UPI00081CCB69|nr:DUF1109 domain-containing protein [Bordetella sp. H567]AOB32232.1 hypothetical protein AKI39_18185 [Bordetella sp. H567]